MIVSVRRLPHIDPADRPVFLTWTLYGGRPANRHFPTGLISSGRAFAAMDRLLDEARTGPFYLRDPSVANVVLEAIFYNFDILRHYSLHAFVIMPNHVHMLITSHVRLSKLTKSLKNITGRRANALLGLTGRSFWQEESYDHVVRNDAEFQRIQTYIEQNPVRAGLVIAASEYPRSSAAGATGGSPADMGVCPTDGCAPTRNE